MHLKANLFYPGSTPFTERIVLVPSVEMERWIRLKLADEMGIFANVTIMSLNQGLLTYCNATSPPSKIALTIAIEEELDAHKDDPLFAPASCYIQGKGRRRVLLAKHLAYLFHRYSIYGVRKWKHPWQEKLWEKVGFTWNVKPTDKPIHLFGFSHIPDQFFPLFQSFFYILSPCKEFWSEAIDHPLLADLGYVGRQLAAQIEDSQIRSVEDYTGENLTLTQRSMLKLEPLEEDPSIEFHVASTPHREVEICYNNLLPLLEKIAPRDILVMAPNISDYAIAIQAVFGPLCQITDLPKISIDLEVKGLWLLLKLEERRFSAPALLELFHHPLFQKKHGWNEESLLQIRKWMQSTGMRWGVDPQHRQSILGVAQSEATLKQGIEQLFEDLAYGSDRIDLTQADLLGTFATTIDSLYAELQSFYDGTKRTLEEWVAHLKALFEAHFCFDNHTLFPALDQLLVYSNRLYTGPMLLVLLEGLLKDKEASFNSHEVESVRFCSLLPMRAIPAKVIYLLGMNQDKFPRTEEHFSLDEVDSAPSQTDLDRYLFLEALLSYREKLFVSYLDTQEEPPSKVLQKLKAKTFFHPAVAHDPSYFRNTPLKNYSQTDFALAKVSLEKSEKPPLFRAPKPVCIPPGIHHISLYDLQRLVRSPLSHYHHEMNFYSESLLKDEEEFTLSPLMRSKVQRLALKMPLDNAIGKLQKEGNFPLGAFADVAKSKLKEISAEGVEFNTELKINSETTIHLTGTLEGIVPDGLFRFDKPTLPNAIKNWPAYLLYALNNQGSLILDGQVLPRFFSSPEPYLNELIAYYFQARECLSPLYPGWIEGIFRGKGDFTSYDPALAWALQTAVLTDDLFAWKQRAQQLFGEIKDAWF